MPRNLEARLRSAEACQKAADLALIYVVRGPDATQDKVQAHHLSEHPAHTDRVINTGVSRSSVWSVAA